MKKMLLVMMLALATPALSQGVRSLGMGGLTLPGPWLTANNPAYAAYPADTYGTAGGISLPLGLINLAWHPSISPLNYFNNFSTFKNNFDIIAFIDQASRPFEFIINPPHSPNEIIFRVTANDISLTDGNGNPIQLSYANGRSGAAGLPLPQPFLEIPISLGFPGLRLSIGAYANTGGFNLSPSDNLALDLARGKLQPNTTYYLTSSAAAEAGITGGLSFATPLPSIPGVDGRIYIGGQLEGFYGLFYDDSIATASTQTDGDGVPGSFTYTIENFYVYPGSGTGYGGRIDLGIVADISSSTFGLGVSNLIGYEQWNGKLRTSDSSGNTTESSKTISTVAFDPAVYLNGAYVQKINPGGTVLLGADLNYASGSLSLHTGLECQQSIFRLRGGIGYENGLKLGLGGGILLPHLSIDAAITSHQAPFTDQMVFGLATSLGLFF